MPSITRIVAGVLMVIAIIGLYFGTGTDNGFHDDNAVGMSANVLIAVHRQLAWFGLFFISIAMYVAGVLEQIRDDIRNDRQERERAGLAAKMESLKAKADGDEDLKRFLST